ncbi:MAG: T9SS type A sorting domain-containing protein [Bacteroidia bacterium]|nr:T9SS type A sorting domain-containing protein [Bacteroidia bacterium]
MDPPGNPPPCWVDGTCSGRDPLYNPHQAYFRVPFVNGDTHHNIYQVGDSYHLISRIRINSSDVNAGDNTPLTPRGSTNNIYTNQIRRKVLAEIGSTYLTDTPEHSLYIALDAYDDYIEPYSILVEKLPGFEQDMYWGLVEGFNRDKKGSNGNKHLTHFDTRWVELAISSDGKTWRWLKPGYENAILPNGPRLNDPDHGDISPSPAIFNTKFHTTLGDHPLRPYYFYKSSQYKHGDAGSELSGVSLARGAFGKLAGLRSDGPSGHFYSPNPVSSDGKISLEQTIFLKLGELLTGFDRQDIGTIADADPANSLAASHLIVRAYQAGATHGAGEILYQARNTGAVAYQSDRQASTWHDPRFGTYQHDPSDYKAGVMNYLSSRAAQGTPVWSLKQEEVKITLEAFCEGKTTLYGFKLPGLQTEVTSEYQPLSEPAWTNIPGVPLSGTHSALFGRWEDFEEPINCGYLRLPYHEALLPNEVPIEEFKQGAISFRVRPYDQGGKQYIYTMHKDDSNYVALYYENNGYHYEIIRRGNAVANIVWEGDRRIVTYKDSLFRYLYLHVEDPSFNANTATISISTNIQDRDENGNFYTVLRVVPDGGQPKEHRSTLLTTPTTGEERVNHTRSQIAEYLLFSSLVPGLDKITIGGFPNSESDEGPCVKGFNGFIYGVEYSSSLNGDGVFWKPEDIQENEEAFQELQDMIDQEYQNSHQAALTIVEDKSPSGFEYQVYPNPATERINFRFNLPEPQWMQAAIYNAQGEKVLDICNWELNAGTQLYHLDANTLTKGIYILKVQTASEVTDTKFVIQ